MNLAILMNEGVFQRALLHVDFGLKADFASFLEEGNLAHLELAVSEIVNGGFFGPGGLGFSILLLRPGEHAAAEEECKKRTEHGHIMKGFGGTVKEAPPIPLQRVKGAILSENPRKIG